ncbi:hypothetical protein Aple_101270 [Acrocarpospora pleiomorpha]|uniref:Uncharacterized protein n=1 Tax=Acrocarpospora pleiomorpha TaxID=90975 RepID=A0A5M3Y1M2_9ACTN|nr:hypothetical protein [Acrocarpospora pleiomorpha]GES27227.1 hypothetical protein Aple_101270 [Acrocarpospora pleiomorpha]
MRVDAAISHYLELFDQTWLAESVAWTVIIADDGPIEVHEIATTLSGGAPPEIWEDTPRIATDHVTSTNHFVPVRSGSHLNLIEPGVIHTNTAEFRSWLSAGRRIWSTSWHIKGGETLVCVENGEVLFGIGEYFETERSFGSGVAAAQRELEIMRQPSLREQKAAALAVMELHSGFRLNLDWLDSPQQVITVDQPIPPGATPPSAFASAEPELAAHLQNVPLAARTSLLIHLVEQLADNYDLRIPQVTTVLDQVRDGNHPIPREWRDLTLETTYLAQDRWFGRPGDAAPEWRRWQAAIAIRHALRSLDTGAQNLESLLSARNALYHVWDSLREEILALPET